MQYTEYVSQDNKDYKRRPQVYKGPCNQIIWTILIEISQDFINFYWLKSPLPCFDFLVD